MLIVITVMIASSIAGIAMDILPIIASAYAKHKNHTSISSTENSINGNILHPLL
ncbi:hypothetical protein IJH26_01290 [Candidatus Saccharibacteria bacterium]|nr:hypothetical protein [Candidatus Saccharibacteria bacterium]MBQ3476129.1 hypothetical protein [Candidatus Saccharibacteria bacterium]